jgi:hypothetical protein
MRFPTIGWQYVRNAYITLIINLLTRVIDWINIARIVDARSQQRPNVFPVHAPLISGYPLLQEKKKILSIMSNLRRVKFRKIPLKNLIDTLIQLHNSGADYVDIIGVEDKVQDVVTLSVHAEYMNNPSDDVPDNIDFINNKLTDDDINDLML